MESLLKELKRILSQADDADQKAMIFQLKEMLWSLETGDDTVNRIGFATLQPSVARIGIDLKIFNILADNDGSQTLAKLQQATGADTLLLRENGPVMSAVELTRLTRAERLLRYMASVGLIKETGVENFAANQVTRNLAQPGNQGAIGHFFDTCGPTFQTLPSFLRRTHYRDIVDEHVAVFQEAHRTDLTAYAWLAANPQNFEYLNQYMASRRPEMAETWLAVHPVEAETRGWAADAPVFVNVGGGIGHQCAEFKARYPNVPGNVILQDLPEVIAQALATPGVENMAHDFFKPQPVKGAKYYYFRGVLHNWPDHRAQEILRNVSLAMDDRSVILIDELVLPPSGVHEYVTGIDLMMMTGLASLERTKPQWQKMLDLVGLEIKEHRYYKPAGCEGVMVVGLKKAALKD